jgi:hypothetical protein
MAPMTQIKIFICAFCTAIAQIDRRLRLKFSCGKTYEFISVGLAGGKERSENAAAKS